METREWRKSRLWPEGDRIYQENKRLFVSFFEKNGGSLLDLGCNDGTYTLEIAEYTGAKGVHGIDSDEKAIKESRLKGVKAEKCDINGRFPYKDNTFDAVSAHQVLEHIFDTRNFFEEVNRVLKPGGYAVISTPNLSSLHSIAFILLGRQPTVLHVTDTQVGNPLKGTRIDQPGHIKAFNVASLKDLAEIYGFKTEKIQGFGFHFLPIRIQRILSKPLGRWAIFLTIKIRKNHKDKTSS
jgi:SAM-dependent methyltransferase